MPILGGMRLFLCSLLCCMLFAAEADPLVDLDPIHNATLLAQLRGRLAQAPATDPGLAAAQMALVNLALGGDLRDRGACGGLWRQRARELRDLRKAAGCTPATFIDAIPDLWVEAMDGRTASCMQALSAFPDAKDHPHARALRTWCTGDWRELRALPGPLGAHERTALALAYWHSGMGQALEQMDHRGLSDFTYGTILCAAVKFSHEGSAMALAAAVQEVVPITISPQLSEAGIAARTVLMQAAKADGPGEALRRALRRNDTGEQGEVLVAAWKVVEAGCSGPQGLRSDDGTWRLIGLGDWSTAARHHLSQALLVRHQFVRMQWGVPEAADRISAPIIAGDTGLLAAQHRHLAGHERNQDDARAFLLAIGKEFENPGPGRIPAARLISYPLTVLRNPGTLKPELDPILRAALRAQVEQETGRAAGWAELGAMLQIARRLDLATTEVAAARDLDPWSVELFRLVKPTEPSPAPAADPITRMPWRLDQMLERFYDLQRRKVWAEAERMGAAILAQDPSHTVARAYGQCLKEQGRVADAIAAWRSYLNNSQAFDTIFVNQDIGKALEELGDFAGAEESFKRAAGSWQNGAMIGYADFLERRGRGREAVTWLERSIERYGDDDKHMKLKTAAALLSGVPSKADIDEAFVRIEQAKSALMSNNTAVWQAGCLIRRLGLHDRFLQLVGDTWNDAKGSLPTRVGILALESGKPAVAVQAFSLAREGKRTNARAMSWIVAWQTLAARVAKQRELEPLPEELRAQIGKGDYMKAIDPLLRFLAGDIDQATALTQAGPDADELRYYLGIAAAARGDLTQARELLQAMSVNHPDWGESGGAKRFLAWLDAGAVATPAPGKAASSDF
jgi:tetratricopeptide (TPR) repeat protein